jgi:hypothetical protein
MTRRNFVRILAEAGAAVFAGILWLAKTPPCFLAKARRWVRALPVKKYPGSLKSLGNVFRQGKWSG